MIGSVSILFAIKAVLSGAATIITILALIPYIRAILVGSIRPHVFTWLIWGFSTLVVGFAQFSDRGGVGVWPGMISGMLTFYIAWLAWKRTSDTSVVLMDWVCLVLALSAIPFWYLTRDALFAVVILTLIDLFGYVPTIRKAYTRPDEEQALLYSIMIFRNLLVIAAFEHYSLTTLFFPVVTTFANMVVIWTVWIRRRQMVFPKEECHTISRSKLNQE